MDDTGRLAGTSPSRLAVLDRLVAARARLQPVLPALRVLGFAFAVAIVVLMAVRAGRDVHPRDLAAWPLPVAFAGAAAWWLGLARGWAVLLRGRVGRSDISVWCRTQALRFLPGGLWAPASRVVVVPGGAFDRLATVAAENLSALCSAVAVGGIALAASGRVWWIAAVPAAAVPTLAARAVAGRTRVTPVRSLTALANYLVAFTAYAAAAALVQVAVSPHADVLAVAGAASIAWAAGLVVVIAPSGIGVRELVYVQLLSGTLPYWALAAAAVTTRLMMIVAELAILLAAGRPASSATAPDREPAYPLTPGDRAR
jgi:hypothetical protein